MTAEKRLIRIDPGEPCVIEETMEAGEFRRRRLDTIDQWVKAGTIDLTQRDAARRFEADFDAAQLQDRYSAQCFDRIDGSPSTNQAERVMMARDRIRQAMYAVGQIGGSVLWDVVGRGDTLGVYVQRHSWTGKNQTAAKGALIGALSSLASHYRL